MRFDVLTLFPDAFRGPLDVSILGRARRDGLLEVLTHDIREHAIDKHRSVDDYPYGGGQGMVLRVDVLDRALTHVQLLDTQPGHVIYLSPAGERFSDRLARELATYPRLVLVCGRYEGVDERFVEHRVDREVSIGDFIVTGGELPAMVLIDAVARHIPGALGDEASSEDESFADGLLEYPQYTRPADYKGWQAPEVLRGGSHAAIEAWKQEQRLARTRSRRPDLAPQQQIESPRPPRGAPWIRTARPEDLDAVRTLISSVTARSMASTPQPEHPPSPPRGRVGVGVDAGVTLPAFVPPANDLFLVADFRKRIVGTLVAGFDGHQGHIYELTVAESSRRFGVATRLLAELERRLLALGCTKLNVAIEPGNAQAEAFLESRGWQRSESVLFSREIPSLREGESRP
jgi:tRNA (guanine37-N1)-methyltransferase